MIETRYLIFIFFAILSIWLISTYHRRKKEKEKHDLLKRSWGRPKEGYFNFNLIEKYHILNSGESNFQKINSQTAKDLDLHEVFRFTDRTVSIPGQQYSYHRLFSLPETTGELKEFDNLSDYFSANSQTRELAQQALLHLQDNNAMNLPELIFPDYPQKPGWFFLIPILSAAAVSMLILLPFWPVAGLIAFLLFIPNLAFHYYNKKLVNRYLNSIPQLFNLLKTSKKLEKLDIPYEKISTVPGSVKSLEKLSLPVSFISFDSKMDDDIFSVIWFLLELVKAYFLVEVISFYYTLGRLNKKREEIHTLFRFSAYLDTAISVASLRESLPVYCKPGFIAENQTISFEGLYHPLIEDCVGNDLSLDQKSVLITESNMSGKTTFIRTVAINNIFALAYYTSFARDYRTPRYKTYSAIRFDDNLAEHKSYYMDEVLTVKSLVDAGETDDPCLFVLDELFKGTNTPERIAGAMAVLSYLHNRGNMVFASTHDLELATLLSGKCDLYHFSEQVEKENLSFDYKLKHGPLTTRNAIKILELSGYPGRVIADAKKALGMIND